jgi:hypothetical protein
VHNDEDGVARCFIDKLEALTPTAAQQKVASDFLRELEHSRIFSGALSIL